MEGDVLWYSLWVTWVYFWCYRTMSATRERQSLCLSMFVYWSIEIVAITLLCLLVCFFVILKGLRIMMLVHWSTPMVWNILCTTIHSSQRINCTGFGILLNFPFYVDILSNVKITIWYAASHHGNNIHCARRLNPIPWPHREIDVCAVLGSSDGTRSGITIGFKTHRDL